MQCPICSEQVAPGEAFCGACDVALAWTGDGSVQARFPPLAPGDVIVSTAFGDRPLPGRPSNRMHREGVVDMEPVQDGIRITYHRAMTGAYVDYGRQLRDACVRATFTPLDHGARLGLAMRHSMVGDTQLYYLFDLVASDGLAWCARSIQIPTDATSTRVSPAVHVPPVTLGQPVELSVHMAGPTMHAYVNGALVASAHDACFGLGSFGIRAGREHDLTHPVQIVCHGYEIRGVAP